MGFEEYRAKASAFDLYYDKFLQNTFRGKLYKIISLSGDSMIGTPTASSIARPNDPQASFSFRRLHGGDVFRIPFSALKMADELFSGSLRTLDPHTVGGGDIDVLVAEADLEAAWALDEGDMKIGVYLDARAQFIDAAPQGMFKFLSVRGSAFPIKSVRRTDPISLELCIESDDTHR